jgi:hypothetical protein
MNGLREDLPMGTSSLGRLFELVRLLDVAWKMGRVDRCRCAHPEKIFTDVNLHLKCSSVRKTRDGLALPLWYFTGQVPGCVRFAGLLLWPDLAWLTSTRDITGISLECGEGTV